MVVLGIAPGVQTLAYSVLAFDGGAQGYPIDSDVLHAGRGTVTLNPLLLAKRCRAHHLILGVVLERNPPAVLAVGPPVSPREPGVAAEAVYLMLRALAETFDVPLADVRRREQLWDLTGDRTLAGAVRKGLCQPLGSRDQRILLATTVAIAGAATARRDRLQTAG